MAQPPKDADLAEQDEVIQRELDERFAAAYDENGVDRSLIRWSLAHTPTERVIAVEETLSALATARCSARRG